MSSSLLLKNIYCLQTSFDTPQQSGVDLLITDNKVKAIAKTGTLSLPSGTKVLDCSHHVVLPGLVNTHHHFYQTLTRNHPAVQNAKLFDWLTFLYDVWKYIDEEAIYYSSLLAMAELAKTGCTLTTDLHYLYPRSFKGDLMGFMIQGRGHLGHALLPHQGLDEPLQEGWGVAA